jgi:hypothetical protein
MQSRLLIAFGRQPGWQRRSDLHLSEVAPPAQRLHGLDHAPQRGLRHLVDRRRLGRHPGRQQPGGGRDEAVDLLRHERDHRVGERERLGEHVQERRGHLRLAVTQPRFDELEVPVAELSVDEVVEPKRGVGQVVGLDSAIHLCPGPCQSRQDPAVLDRDRSDRRPRARVHPEEDQAGGVPQLVHEREALSDSVLTEADVLRRGHREKAPAQRVGAVGGEVAALLEHGGPWPALDQIERVDPGAQGLGHPPSVGSLDDGVDVDVGEGDLPHELQPHHDHSRDPEEDDVAGRDEHVGRIEGAQLRGLIGPPERGERPQRAREPRVEHVRITLPALPLRWREPDVGLLPAIPDRQPVTPPELARDDPGTDVLHPVHVDARLALRDEAHTALADDLCRRLRELVHAHEPLQRDQRLDPLTGALRERDLVKVILLVSDQALLAQRRHDRAARLHRREAPEGLGRRVGDPPVLADHADLLQPVPTPDLEVVGVVARGDLERAGAEVRLDVFVGEDRKPPPDQRQDRLAPHEIAVALVLRVHRDRGVSEHRLGPDGGHGDAPVAGGQWIVDVVQGVRHPAVLDLEVGDRRPAPRIPVDHVAVAVDVALLVQGDEHARHGRGVVLIEREVLVLVVAGGAEALELLDDLAAVLRTPFPDPSLEGLAPELLPARSL